MDIGVETFNTIIEGKEYSCISIGEKGIELPTFMMQGVKSCGYIIRGGVVESWYWDGLTIAQEKRCIYFKKMDLFPLTDIATKKRSKALAIVRDLAKALSLVSTKFLDLSSGIIPIWRIWGLEDGGFLILPQNLADLFSSCANEEVRSFQSTCWVHHDNHKPFSLCDQMTQLLYFACMGFPPFQSPETREDAFRALPVSLYSVLHLPTATSQFIDKTLSLSLTKQRDIGGNKESKDVLSWFIGATEDLQWTLEDRDEATSREDLKLDLGCGPFLEKQKKRADWKIFWRKKGWIVASIAAVVIVVFWISGSAIKASLTPPYTAGMSNVQIIDEYYTGQSELDVQKMEASLSKKAKNPASLEVSNLFVSRQTRQAYEGLNTQVNPNEWIANGKPAIMEGTYLYGVTDVQVEQIGDNTYKATSILYTPYAYIEENGSEEIQPGAGHAFMYHYQQVQKFTLGLSKHGWTEITSITNESILDLGIIEVETYPAPNKVLSGQTAQAQ
ncbi:hypothetical protein SpiGrapes_3235 [Sphaerochaeta pleomorpha str. Grapes]|uniref:Uncharacterized protein n=1 Tax=Sphaerochaeta pleomorpha (strain ATCC BAA-1885 / DSM 22778 / Grapes) TaxID=158190 RepID=G8QR44_SPHPG|nr:hypothetical protein [Sphaerochaeta pleomorpha]AEV30979.1 hypothetical protein SpiGrapes_3235 [Sphaerochaeta pleomorpha str. Grapes]